MNYPNSSISDCKSYFIGLKIVFGWKFWEFFPHKVKKIVLCEVRFNPHEVRLNWTLETFWEGIFGAIFCQLSSHQPFIIVAITKNHKNDYHDSPIQDRDLYQQPTPSLGPSST